VKRAEVAGCKAIVFTVDVPLLGRRERDVRNQFKLPDDLSVKNLLPAGLQEFADGTAGSRLAPYIASLFDPSSHGAFRLPDVELNNARSPSAIVRLAADNAVIHDL
jgi:hypothetical protein